MGAVSVSVADMVIGAVMATDEISCHYFERRRSLLGRVLGLGTPKGVETPSTLVIMQGIHPNPIQEFPHGQEDSYHYRRWR